MLRSFETWWRRELLEYMTDGRLLLCKRGRSTIPQLLLTDTPIYFMSLLKMQAKTIKILEMKVKDFDRNGLGGY